MSQLREIPLALNYKCEKINEKFETTWIDTVAFVHPATITAITINSLGYTQIHIGQFCMYSRANIRHVKRSLMDKKNRKVGPY